MTGNKIEQLLDRYKEYLDQGVTAYRRGNLKESREYLLLAAERLYSIADLSADELRETRIAAAGELLEQVEGIDEEIDAQCQTMEDGSENLEADSATDDDKPFATMATPDIILSDVAGLEDVKQLIRDKLIDPFLYPELKKEFGIKSGGGILLYGPPGTGKTMIARAIAGEVKAAFYPVTPSDIMSKWVGDPEKNIRNLFDEARKHERAVIFFDEIDGLASSRQRGEDYMRRLVNQLLAEIQGFDQPASSVLFIGATNHPHLLDHALLRPGRLDELVYVPLPDISARQKIWELKLAGIERLGEIDFSRLAKDSDGYSGSEIEYVCQKAAIMAGRRWKNQEPDTLVEMDDILQALDLIKPRTSIVDIEALQAFGCRYDRNLSAIPEKNAMGFFEKSKKPFSLNPQGFDLEDFIEKLIAPYPTDPELLPALVKFFSGKHIVEISAQVTEAVRNCFERISDPVTTEQRLAIENFIVAQKSEEENVRAMVEDCRAFLSDDDLNTIEKELEEAKPDFKALEDFLYQKTYHCRLEQLVDQVCLGLELPQRILVRLRRKTIRAIEKAGELPTIDSLNTRMMALLTDMRTAERDFLANNDLETAKIMDVRQLIVKHSPFDFADLAGMETLREQMEFAVETPLNPEKREQYENLTGEPPKNPAMLLYGAPGCGKTFLALAAAGEFSQRYGFTIIHVPARAVAGLHYSKHLERIVEIFNLAKEKSPSIVIWDEFDGIAESADFSGRKHQVTVCSELKGQFEGVIKSKALVVHIATSNYPWNLENALMRDGRLGEPIHVLPPDLPARREIIEMILEKASAVKDLDYEQLADWTAGMTTTEIRSVISGCLHKKAEKTLSGSGCDGGGEIGMVDLEMAITNAPKKDFITWLTNAKQKLNMKKYACQREFFPGLLEDITRNLDNEPVK